MMRAHLWMAALCLCLSLPQLAFAQPSPTQSSGQAPMTRAVRQRLWGYGLLGGGAGLVLAAAGVYGASVALNNAGCPDEDCETFGRTVAGLTLAGFAGMWAIPLGATIAIDRVGARAGRHGRFGLTFLAAASGLLGTAAVLTPALIGVSELRSTDDLTIFVVAGVGALTMVVASTGLGVFAYRRSDARALKIKITASAAPTLSGDGGSAMLRGSW